MSDPTRYQVRLVGPDMEPVDAFWTTDEQAWVYRLHDLRIAAATALATSQAEVERLKGELTVAEGGAKDWHARFIEARSDLRDATSPLLRLRTVERDRALAAERLARELLDGILAAIDGETSSSPPVDQEKP